jgi:hydroxyacylglutathione hydrolase
MLKHQLEHSSWRRIMRADIASFVNPGLGHSSYLVDLGDGTALVIDPARIPTEQIDHAAGRGLVIAYTADTHTHADYISGSPDLAERGARFLAPAAAELVLDHRGLVDGDVVEVGRFRLEAIATPGHTPDHLSYLLSDEQGPIVLFSGGSLMVGTVGRTDLLGDERREELARQMHRALHERILTLPGDLAVYPTHGAGSFCSAPGGGDRTTTIGRELATDPLLSMDEDVFVDHLLAGFGSFPDYFRLLPSLNRNGRPRLASVPRLASLTVDDVDRLTAAGAVVVDARPIAAFAAGHIPGSRSIELRPAFASWFGWLTDLDRSVVFVLDDDQDEVDLVRQALTVGHDDLAGRLAGGMATWVAAGRPVALTPLVEATAVEGTLVDIRQDDEWAAGHVPEASHVELAQLRELDPAHLPEGPLTVMCGHGERAMTGASLLEAVGRPASVLSGGPGDWVAATGRPLTSP